MSLELNKIAGAVLVAALVAHVSGTVASILVQPEHGAGHGEMAGGHDAGGTAPVETAPAPLEPVSPLLAAADAAAGQAVAKKCATCHSFEDGGANKVGPNLWNIVSSPTAHLGDAFAYSDALKAVGGAWDYETLNAFIAQPKTAVPGTKMAFAGIKSAQDRANLIAYLRSLSPSPAALPDQAAIDAALAAFQAASAPAEAAPAEGEATADATSAEAGAETATNAGTETAEAAADIATLMASADPAAGQAVAKKCATCHTFEEGGANKIGPNLWNIVGAPAAHLGDGFKYSDAMKGSGFTWDYATLDKYLADPKGTLPGNKMSFIGIKKPEDRANLIAYLRTLSASPLPLP